MGNRDGEEVHCAAFWGGGRGDWLGWHFLHRQLIRIFEKVMAKQSIRLATALLPYQTDVSLLDIRSLHPMPFFYTLAR